MTTTQHIAHRWDGTVAEAIALALTYTYFRLDADRTRSTDGRVQLEVLAPRAGTNETQWRKLNPGDVVEVDDDGPCAIHSGPSHLAPDYHMGVSGEPVYFADPSRTAVIWHDLVCLDKQHRFLGQAGTRVLRHLGVCVAIAQKRGYPVRVVGLAAAHDLHEAYIGDFPGPLKRHLPRLAAIEDAWHAHVHRSLGLALPTNEETALVKDIDEAALRVEAWSTGHANTAMLCGKDYEPNLVERGAWAAVHEMGPIEAFALVRNAVEAAAGTIPNTTPRLSEQKQLPFRGAVHQLFPEGD